MLALALKLTLAPALVAAATMVARRLGHRAGGLVGGLRGGLDLLDLAGAQVGVGMRLVAMLDGLADDGHPRRPQQLAQLGQVVALGQRRDAEGALLRPALLLGGGDGARWRGATVATAFHCSVPV